MISFKVKGAARDIHGALSMPGDKSIAHRCAILGALSPKVTTLTNFPLNDDCLATLSLLKQLGIPVDIKGKTVRIHGKGLRGLRRPCGRLLVRESGTTFRLMLGVLAGQGFPCELSAGRSLAARPMLRVTAPLRSMGAGVKGKGKGGEEYPPVDIRPAALHAISYQMPVASAQVKSALLLAGLYAAGTTRIKEKLTTRDHTERLLASFKADIHRTGKTVSVSGGRSLVSPGRILIPGDISSAAFFAVLGAIIPGSRVTIKDAGLNGTRTGFISVLKRMGAGIRIRRGKPGAEPYGDITVTGARLKGTRVGRQEIPSLIDELPILMVAAACAGGETVFDGVEELRVKETDRIRSMLENLALMGAKCRVKRRGKHETIVITGSQELTGASVKSYGDHRTAMSMIIAGLKARGATRIDDVSCIDKSFPGFIAALAKMKVFLP
ncbi:MAG: 3-phosphoshikimate 1-carboxyvinyltransferase [Deltaproteobacteria bacterium]